MSGFHRNKGKKDGYAYDCKKCRQAKREEYRAKNPLKHLKERWQATIALWKKQYATPPSLSFEEYVALWESSGGHCALCERSGKLYLDHDHKTNRIRGFLCNPCNLALGLFQDDKDRLTAAVAYLS